MCCLCDLTLCFSHLTIFPEVVIHARWKYFEVLQQMFGKDRLGGLGRILRQYLETFEDRIVFTEKWDLLLWFAVL